MSAPHDHGLLAELVAGTLAAEERPALERHLERCARCRGEAERLSEAVSALALALDPVASPPDGRERLLGAACGGRVERFAGEVAELIDVPLARARELLDAIDTPDPWLPGMTPAVQFYHLPPGPAVQASLVGFLRVTAGESFPRHRHLGEERVLVLQGALREEDGTIRRRGELVVSADASEHAFAALPGPDLVFLVVLQGGLEIAGHLSDV